METPIISQDLMTALIGRPLTSAEVENYDLYLGIAVARLDDLLCTKIEDMEDLPDGLKLLVGRCFATLTLEQGSTSNFGISSKKVEDFSISYHAEAYLESSPMKQFVQQNLDLLNKYSECQAPMRAGETYGNDCIRCL